MRRSSAITGLIVKALHMLHETVDVLSEPERDVAMRDVGTATKRVC